MLNIAKAIAAAPKTIPKSGLRVMTGSVKFVPDADFLYTINPVRRLRQNGGRAGMEAATMRVYAAALAMLFSAVVAARADDYGQAQCPSADARKWSPKATLCLPRTPRTWIVCTGFPTPAGDGQWKDTGVPCEAPPPRSPADYRPAAIVRHPPPAPNAKRVIDQFLGIYFHCTPTAKVSWTGEACGEISQEFARQAEAAKIAHVYIAAFESDDVKQAKGAAAGIPLGSEVQWTLTFKVDEAGELSLHPQMTGVVEMFPGIWSARPIIIGGDIGMESRATKADAVGAAKDLIKGDLDYLLASH